MGGIKYKGGFGGNMQSVGDYEHEKPEISYCPRCEKNDILSILKERIYPKDQTIPRDHELWKQCHECGQIVPIYEVKKESSLKDFVETSTNPFDQVDHNSIVALDNKKKKTRAQKDRERQLKEIEKETDEDIKREIRMGNTVEIIE